MDDDAYTSLPAHLRALKAAHDLAAKGDDERLEELLLSSSLLDINSNTAAKWNPLHAACRSGSAACVEVLLRRRADVNWVHNRSGATALMVASFHNNVVGAKCT